MPEQAAQIVAAAWRQDEDWGTFVWVTMVTGMRRAELLRRLPVTGGGQSSQLLALAEHCRAVG